MAKKLTNELLNLPPEIRITNYTHSPGCIDVYISFPEGERVCPDCGSHRCVIKSSPTPETARHLPCSRIPVRLHFKRRRFRCKDCGRTFYEPLDWLCSNLHMTFDLHLSILLDLTEKVSRRDVALKNGVSPATVDSVLKQIPLPRPAHLPRTLCIDEFKGNSGVWNPSKKRWKEDKFHCSIADGDSGVIIDVLPEIGADTLKKYFLQYSLQERQRVKYFCCDMHGGFYNVARDCFPDAVICADMFHVVNLLNTAMDNVRRRIQNDVRDTDPEKYRLLKHLARALKTKDSNKEHLWDSAYDRKQSQLERVFNAFPDLMAVNDAIQNFHVLLDEKSYRLQRVELTDWLKENCSSEVEELRKAAASIRLRRGYIQNSWKYLKSNGPCEGLNNKIKTLKRISFGVHSFEMFRKRILLVCGYFHCVSDRTLAIRGLSSQKKEVQ